MQSSSSVSQASADKRPSRRHDAPIPDQTSPVNAMPVDAHPMPRLRLALLLPTLRGGGAERLMVEIAGGLVRRGHAVDLLVTHGGGPYWNALPRNVQLINLGDACEDVARFASWKSIACLPGLIKYLRRERPDVLLSSLNPANVTALLAKRFFGKDLRLIMRQESTFSAQFALGHLEHRMALRMIRWGSSTAAAIIATSCGVADDFKRAVPRAAHLVQHVPNPVVTPALFENARLPVDHPWFSDWKTPIIVTAGSLIPVKDHRTLLAAFAEVVRARPARLIILGQGPDRHQLEAFARASGIAKKVDFVGFQANPYAWMAKAQVFALSSRREGLPGALIEAMACGTPVVSTDCPSGPREILENGRLGRLVPVGDPQALARGILDALEHPVDPARLVARARDFSADASIDGHMNIIRSVV